MRDLKTLLSIKEAKKGIETYFDEKIKFSDAHKEQIITFLESVIRHLTRKEED